MPDSSNFSSSSPSIHSQSPHSISSNQFIQFKHGDGYSTRSAPTRIHVNNVPIPHKTLQNMSFGHHTNNSYPNEVYQLRSTSNQLSQQLGFEERNMEQMQTQFQQFQMQMHHFFQNDFVNIISTLMQRANNGNMTPVTQASDLSSSDLSSSTSSNRSPLESTASSSRQSEERYNDHPSVIATGEPPSNPYPSPHH